MSAQSLSTKRAEVEFHNFASLGEPERAFQVYGEENQRRSAVLREYTDLIGPMTPFLEIGANAGHSSYMLSNEFGAQGFALDISAHALRYGRVLMDRWSLERAPIRIAGDAVRLPFADHSVRFVMTFQTLSQFLDLDVVFREIYRVLQPGGFFFFAEEPVRRMLTLGLYRAPYEEQMKSWEKRLHRWGLLGYLTKDVIGAAQEENFGIRQNHTMTLRRWHRLITRYFEAPRYRLFVPQRGWGEKAAYRMGRRIDRHGSDWVPARLLGGTIAALCRKPGDAPTGLQERTSLADHFEKLLRCPDCSGSMRRGADEALACPNCGYEALNDEEVYNLLPSAERRELYPGSRDDLIDFSMGPCEDRIVRGFYEVEGVFGNKYRWMQREGVFRLRTASQGPLKLRIRGHIHPRMLEVRSPARIQIRVNGERVGQWSIGRPGLFVIEAPVAAAPEHLVTVEASPEFSCPPDQRKFTVNLSLMRLVRESG